MEIPKKVVETVDARTVSVFAKVRDAGSYTLKNHAGEEIASKDQDYVPKFFPGDHYGDYLEFDIDLETGRIVNWKTPSPMDVAHAFNLIEEE